MAIDSLDIFTKLFKSKRLSRLVLTAILSTSFVSIPASLTQAAGPIGDTANRDVIVTAGTGTGDLAFAFKNSSTADAVMVTSNTTTANARSLGLGNAGAVSASGLALTQSVTMAASGTLSLYALAATSMAISWTGGTIAASATANTALTGSTSATETAFYSLSTATGVGFTHTASGTAHTAAILWTAPSTAGTYYIYAYRAMGPGTAGVIPTPTATNPTLGVKTAEITVTVSSGIHGAPGDSNIPATLGGVNSSLYVATSEDSAITGAVVLPTDSELGDGEDIAKSKGLLAKSTSIGTAQTATVLAGGKLSLYAFVSTAAAFSASGGSFSDSTGGPTTAPTVTYSSDLKTSVLVGATESARKTVATIWTAPSTAGTYTVKLLTGFRLDSSGNRVAPTTSDLPPTLSGQITVTVTATSAGGSYSAVYSACNTTANFAGLTSAALITGVDSSASMANGASWGIALKLRDAYDAALDSGNLVASATNGALISWGTAATLTSTPTAGTGSTVVAYRAGSSDVLLVSQPTAGAPLTTTVTITYNGTTVCTKTVSIGGKVAKLTVSNVGTQDLSGTTSDNTYAWIGQQLGIDYSSSGALFAVLATDSAGNIVATDGLGTFSSVASTLTTVVQAVAVNRQSTSSSSSNLNRFALGSWQCGTVAGQASVKIKFTTTATGEAVESDAFTARCADNPYTYTVSFDKATYTQGELATATVKFLDSKGNAANSTVSHGASTWSLPYMTGVSFTLPTGATSTGVTKADGTLSYTFTVGTTSGVTAGTYTGVIEYTALVNSAKSTPTYKIVTGGDTTTNADVLKSIVALIASINKQIQALQKLILKR
jgi:hypothetical protein